MSEREEKKTTTQTATTEESYFLIVRTVGGQEYNVALIMKARIESKNLGIPSLIILPQLKGLIFVEKGLPHIVQNLISGIKHCRGMLRGKVPLSEIVKAISRPVEIHVGDIVEIVSGPFRGYKGKVMDIDNESGTVTIEIMDAASPMPITLRIKDVRLLERKREGE